MCDLFACIQYILSLESLESRESGEPCRIYKTDQMHFQLHLAMLSYMLHGYLPFIIFMSGAAEPVCV